ncbi:hypothetical protein MUK70_11905 [Dyadobacter chenwenxiniae]|uniref:Uncharacterized protein n=1 Tax=Dyadobacter chenwenxiniae TaxID=2906456 RepID=A0A9X1PIF2_9BACT|nr:hypothetical protein [Dyadobacter chenwenxiniae]MCF0059946.1 hypothetical protein [Dyadobacter chenwenxiniae]UON85685.1 hypothetical protein MUK70_11905 [Dyadobacter chenwenxiniae]
MRFKEVSISAIQEDLMQFRISDGLVYIPNSDFVNEEYTISDIGEHEAEAFENLFEELKKRRIPFYYSISLNGDLYFRVENIPGFSLADEMKKKQLRIP